LAAYGGRLGSNFLIFLRLGFTYSSSQPIYFRVFTGAGNFPRASMCQFFYWNGGSRIAKSKYPGTALPRPRRYAFLIP